MAKDPRRTEPATPKRRKKAREEGQVARSIELNNTGIFLAIIINMIIFGKFTYRHLFDILQDFFSNWLLINLNPTNTNFLLQMTMKKFLFVISPWLLITAFIGFFINIFQVGWFLTWKPIQPKLSKIDPIKGFKRFFSKELLVNLLKSLLKIIIIAIILYFTIKDDIYSIILLMDKSPYNSLSYISHTTFKIILKIFFLFLIPLGIIDFVYQKFEYEENLKMTKEEIKDEMRQSEGDPEVKKKIRSKQLEIARRRMMQEVPKADVVITNPTHLAIALQYDKLTMIAPKVIAKGAGIIAERIKEIARENNIPIVENKPLAQTLFKIVELGDFIPENLYKAVAEVLAYVYKLKGVI